MDCDPSGGDAEEDTRSYANVFFEAVETVRARKQSPVSKIPLPLLEYILEEYNGYLSGELEACRESNFNDYVLNPMDDNNLLHREFYEGLFLLFDACYDEREAFKRSRYQLRIARSLKRAHRASSPDPYLEEICKHFPRLEEFFVAVKKQMDKINGLEECCIDEDEIEFCAEHLDAAIFEIEIKPGMPIEHIDSRVYKVLVDEFRDFLEGYSALYDRSLEDFAKKPQSREAQAARDYYEAMYTLFCADDTEDYERSKDLFLAAQRICKERKIESQFQILGKICSDFKPIQEFFVQIKEYMERIVDDDELEELSPLEIPYPYVDGRKKAIQERRVQEEVNFMRLYAQAGDVARTEACSKKIWRIVDNCMLNRSYTDTAAHYVGIADQKEAQNRELEARLQV